MVHIKPAARIGDPRTAAGEVPGGGERAVRTRLRQVAPERVIAQREAVARLHRRRHPARKVGDAAFLAGIDLLSAHRLAPGNVDRSRVNREAE